jgi:hypothetical protein
LAAESSLEAHTASARISAAADLSAGAPRRDPMRYAAKDHKHFNSLSFCLRFRRRLVGMAVALVRFKKKRGTYQDGTDSAGFDQREFINLPGNAMFRARVFF